MPNPIKPGDFVIYTKRNTDHRELGRVKRRMPDNRGWFVWYTDGDTAAGTPDDCLTRCRDQRNPLAHGPYQNHFTDPMSIGGADARATFERPTYPCDTLLAESNKFYSREDCPNWGSSDCPLTMHGAVCFETIDELEYILSYK